MKGAVQRAQRATSGSASIWSSVAAASSSCRSLLVSDPADAAGVVGYVVLLDWTEGRIAAIRDFRDATYVMESLAVARP